MSFLVLGLFTVAIFRPFRLIFDLIFSSFSIILAVNKSNEVKNEVKNDVKIGYCEHPGTQIFENEAKMHFTCTSAVLVVLGTFELHLKGLNKKKFAQVHYHFHKYFQFFYVGAMQLHSKYILLTTKHANLQIKLQNIKNGYHDHIVSESLSRHLVVGPSPSSHHPIVLIAPAQP